MVMCDGDGFGTTQNYSKGFGFGTDLKDSGKDLKILDRFTRFWYG
jgi:hypothetical protein